MSKQLLLGALHSEAKAYGMMKEKERLLASLKRHKDELGIKTTTIMSKQLIDTEEIYGESNDRYLNYLIPFIFIVVAIAIADNFSGFHLHEWIASLIG